MNVRGISTGMYGWTERWKADGKEPAFAELFRACAEAGIDAVEIDATPETLALARSFGLAVSASYVGLPLHVPYADIDADRTVMPFAERLAEAGGTDLLLNADPKGSWRERQPKTDDDLKRQGENLTRIAERVGTLGLNVCMHNHADSKALCEADLRSVVEFAGESVGLCVDTGWAHSAGCDPTEWVRQYPERVFAFHLRNQSGRVPTEDLTEGDIDFAGLFRAAEAANYEGWLALELWHPPETKPVRSMVEDTVRSIAFVNRLLNRP
ncbi:sugar phosphate isomerase/epimerase family protein [Paenibacillus flagellatus]|uniref:Xylose isomerase-like TIM barrel domain-containing protein n=1 Tax=Paenibacillus flagellatus TaxID=2211139 RepID=A0A2V5K6A6_9BACL|nr:sugar phosphate isomerase/epimerase [Paenibacillus flagellatus]PYI53474.1 hypothetical protein DLM86_17015 [Paenibacillus flagellatus]